MSLSTFSKCTISNSRGKKKGCNCYDSEKQITCSSDCDIAVLSPGDLLAEKVILELLHHVDRQLLLLKQWAFLGRLAPAGGTR